MMKLSAGIALGVLLLTALTAKADEPGFSWLEASASSLHPKQSDTGHGGRLALSYALSSQAFMDINAEQQNFNTNSSRRYGFGVGINTDPAAGYVLFARVGWNNLGLDNGTLPGQRTHGFDAGAGIRAWLGQRWEVDAELRYTHNLAATAASNAVANLWYALSPRWAVGAGLDVNSGQVAYHAGLRVYY